MELSYWNSRWKKGNIGFHMEGGYPGLRKNWHYVSKSKINTVLVPLCGKTTDLAWLSKKCENVIGVEISEKAVLEFFTEHNLKPRSHKFGDFTIYRADNIEIWLGDFFKLPKHKLPEIDLIYDKAALVALPEDMRKRYAQKIVSLLSDNTHILLHHFIYNHEEMNGPPFSVTHKEIKQYFGSRFRIDLLEKNELSIENFKKFQNRGLKSTLIEFLLLLLPRR